MKTRAIRLGRDVAGVDVTVDVRSFRAMLGSWLVHGTGSDPQSCRTDHSDEHGRRRNQGIVERAGKCEAIDFKRWR